MRILSVAGILFVVSYPEAANAAYCMQPDAPSFYARKPSLPYCSPRCSEWEVQMYKNEVESYFRKLKEYARQVDDYYEEAGTYIKCMAKLD